jgi:hypothetical protein
MFQKISRLNLYQSNPLFELKFSDERNIPNISLYSLYLNSQENEINPYINRIYNNN